jgi:hypothetical protein
MPKSNLNFIIWFATAAANRSFLRTAAATALLFAGLPVKYAGKTFASTAESPKTQAQTTGTLNCIIVTTISQSGTRTARFEVRNDLIDRTRNSIAVKIKKHDIDDDPIRIVLNQLSFR